MTPSTTPQVTPRRASRRDDATLEAATHHRRDLASIVIPAHNEEDHIGGLLESLASSRLFARLRVVVVVNGSTDQTYEIARRHAGVDVVRVAAASKIAALNEGDRRAGDVYPRLYVDADVQLAPGTIESMIEVLQGDSPLVASPPSRVVTSGCSYGVRAFYRALEIHPVVAPWRRESMSWRRIYGANAAARARFGAWPTLLNDDGYFEALFAPSERVITSGGMVTASAPLTLSEEYRRQRRIARGNEEIRHYFASSGLTRHVWRQSVADGAVITRARRRLAAWLRPPLTRQFWRGGASGLVVRALMVRAVRIELRWRRPATVSWS